jgi:hypothetical protein
MRSRFTLFVALALVAGACLPGAAVGVGKVVDGSAEDGLGEVDNRRGAVSVTAAQRARVEALGATARFNRFGTVQSLVKYGDYLATGLGANPTAAAREFISQNRELFRLSPAGIDALQVLTDAPLTGDAGHAIVFRQRFGGVPALLDGIIAVAVRDGKVSYASSSSAGDGNAPAAASISPAQAWVAAARDVGVSTSVPNVARTRAERGWSVLDVSGFDAEQRARPGAVPTPRGGVVPAYETLVIGGHVAKGDLPADGAYRHFIDARSGAVLFRQNIELHASQAEAQPFDGTLVAGCAPKEGPYTAPENTKSIDTVATADNPANDITIELYRGTEHVAHGDSGTSPEAIHYAPPGGVPAGDYFVEVCMFEDAEPLPPPTYRGSIVVNDVVDPNPALFPPQWSVFPASPNLAQIEHFPWNYPNTDTREVWCWETAPGCDRQVENLASRVPWDYDPTVGAATSTTEGNAASTSESWTDPLAPGPFGFKPVAADRRYFYPWNNTWFQNRCSQTSLAWPNEPDLAAAVTNLFAMHNRMHDWSYFLGFTEEHWNAQKDNFGSPTAEGDPVLGDTQAGALLPVQAGVSRDNANMRPLPDGVPPITNMYLWQPIGGTFYAPCVDGDFDMPVIGHEYGHLIENRMIGKGGTRSGTQAGAMGESFGDFDAVEYLREAGFVPVDGENPFSVGAYVTGDKQKGIRNFAMNWPATGPVPGPGSTPAVNPLHYGAVGYDFVCNAPLIGPPVEDPCPNRTQVHADGEIWSVTNYDIRQALVAKYNDQFPESDQALQEKCAYGAFADEPEQCPGNRRWIQLVYDAMLLMPVGPSMLDARDAYLAADQNRFGGANQQELWRVFAKRGLGQHAFSNGNSDHDPEPSFESAVQNESTVKFRVLDGEQAIQNATIFVGWYEAAVTPIADTNPATSEPPTNQDGSPDGDDNLDDTAKFVPGAYELLVQAPGYGHQRVRLQVPSITSTLTVRLEKNLASASNGAVATGDGANHGSLIDDTETTNWVSFDSPGGVTDDFVIVDLSGSAPVAVSRFQVSAMLREPDPENAGDPSGQSRFSALRSFEIWTCDANVPPGNCPIPVKGVNYQKRYTSPDDFFPSTAPRPVSPDLLLRSFKLESSVNATHVMLVVRHNQCTGGPDFQGDQDNDPTNNTDCNVAAAANDVRAAELQVYTR